MSKEQIEPTDIAADVQATRQPDESEKYRAIDGFKAILNWCDSEGEPAERCLHEIEQICRRHLGLSNQEEDDGCGE